MPPAPSPPTSEKLRAVKVATLSWLLYPLCPFPAGATRFPTAHVPPRGGGISGVARDVATCAAEAVCVRGGSFRREGRGRGPTGSDITPVPLSPPTPLKNPEPVSLPPSRHPPPFFFYSFPSKLTGPTTGTVLPFPWHVPFSPCFPSSTLKVQKLLPCAYPRSLQVGSQLRSRDRSIESLEYKELREASVEYKAVGAGLVFQLEKAPGRKPGERARGEGLGAAGKFALAEKSAPWGNFHPAHKGRRASGENSFPSSWDKDNSA